MARSTLLASSVAALALLAALPATAQDFTFSWGGTITSNYISRGETQTGNRPAFQPWVEVEANGFYGGLWASNVRFGGGDPDRVELDIYAGYRWSIENTSFDIGYARYLYDRSGDAGGEFYALVEHDAGALTIFSGAYFGHSGSLTLNDAHAGVSLSLMDNLSASTSFGRSGGSNYGDVGLTYAINDNYDVDARVYRSNVLGTRAVVSLSFAF
ncbi:MAG: hypothetical protein JJU15_15005 [Pararhodobacter sp.]|nr:hypothetical protein [Pararhodobacter sp.]